MKLSGSQSQWSTRRPSPTPVSNSRAVFLINDEHSLMRPTTQRGLLQRCWEGGYFTACQVFAEVFGSKPDTYCLATLTVFMEVKSKTVKVLLEMKAASESLPVCRKYLSRLWIGNIFNIRKLATFSNIYRSKKLLSSFTMSPDTSVTHHGCRRVRESKTLEDNRKVRRFKGKFYPS